MKPITPKKPSKDQRERLVLLGLVDLYLSTGKPVGSNTLRENGFGSLSSATIRNYFSKLEEAGYLKQQHSSGGRIPTSSAFKLYAEESLSSSSLEGKEKDAFAKELQKETKEISSYLLKSAEVISTWTNAAVFLSAPRFDQDFVLDVRLVSIDSHRYLCVLITDFGMTQTEMLYSDKKLTSFTLKKIEQFFRFKITGLDRPDLSKEEEGIALQFYNEAMLRHIVTYTNFSSMDLYKTGFSRLLSYGDFNDATSLAQGLSFFENNECLRLLLSESCKKKALSCWIGEDLSFISPYASSCSVICVPYKINQSIAGAIGILGPHRIPYKKLFGLLNQAAESISQSLTKSLYKYKISFRHPANREIKQKQEPLIFLEQTSCLLLEDKTRDEL